MISICFKYGSNRIKYPAGSNSCRFFAFGRRMAASFFRIKSVPFADNIKKHADSISPYINSRMA